MDDIGQYYCQVFGICGELNSNIAELRCNGVKIFPNPAFEYIAVEIQNTGYEEIKVEIFDINGTKVLFREYYTDYLNEIIELNNLSIGVYTIKISLGSESSIYKLILMN